MLYELNTKIEKLRQSYQSKELVKADVGDDPIKLFKEWFDVAVDANILEPNAMTMATVGIDGRPTARTVLFKGFSKNKGLIFYTNYNSSKGQQLLNNPFAALVFCYLPLARQIRLEGRVKKLDQKESEKYFQSRPLGSQFGAWMSPQSEEISSKQELIEKRTILEEKYKGLDKLPLPEHWGGYELLPDMVEFWQGKQDRLHDRFRFDLQSDGWRLRQLAP